MKHSGRRLAVMAENALVPLTPSSVLPSSWRPRYRLGANVGAMERSIHHHYES